MYCLLKIFFFDVCQREGVSNWERYSWSVFKSTSHMLCIGYGQFPPKSIIDLWVTYFSMCTGAMCFALFIGNATSLIQSMDASKRSYKEKVNSTLCSHLQLFMFES